MAGGRRSRPKSKRSLILLPRRAIARSAKARTQVSTSKPCHQRPRHHARRDGVGERTAAEVLPIVPAQAAWRPAIAITLWAAFVLSCICIPLLLGAIAQAING